MNLEPDIGENREEEQQNQVEVQKFRQIGKGFVVLVFWPEFLDPRIERSKEAQVEKAGDDASSARDQIYELCGGL